MDDNTFDLSEELEESEKGPEFQASYDSECDSCGQDIAEGDLVRYDSAGNFVHTECA